MLSKRLPLLFLIAILFGACSSEADKGFSVFPVDPDNTAPADITEIAENVEVIPLETADSCMVGKWMQAKVTPDYLFVASARTKLFQFDRKGKFLRQIGKPGKGPGEYGNRFSDFAVSPKDEMVYMLSRKKVMAYSFDGAFMGSFPTGGFGEFIHYKDGVLRVFSKEFGVKSEGKQYNVYNLHSYDSKGTIIDSLSVNKVHTPKMVVSVGPAGTQYFASAGGNDYVFAPVMVRELGQNDTLFQLKNRKLKASVLLDFGEKGRGENRAISLMNLFRTERYLFSSYMYERKSRMYCRDMKTGKEFNLVNGFSVPEWSETPLMLLPLDVTDNKLYFYQWGHDLEGKIDGVTEESNPVIFVVNLKK
ncbi:hypothetical protein FUAX_34950 [Fulvitalea axinellae]|uniref:6-bladed beta-propeller n=1 Tax=Fulvitalea axinellae TaxID=1182444 RepID=A0AAU9D4Z4_9BACT|nr:hypothetical protein FUAX_34950 [Fulvitalea axinellae]